MADARREHGVEVWTIRAQDGPAQASFVPAFGGIGSSIVLPTAAGAREVFFRHDHFWDPDTDAVSHLVLPDGVRLHLQAQEATPGVRLFRYVQCYTMPDLPFFCIEPWMHLPNALNGLPDLRRIPPGATDRAGIRLWNG